MKRKEAAILLTPGRLEFVVLSGKQGERGIVTALDIGDIARGLHRMLSDRPFARACGDRGAQMVRERYTWPTIAARVIDVYEEFGGVSGKGNA